MTQKQHPETGATLTLVENPNRDRGFTDDYYVWTDRFGQTFAATDAEISAHINS